MFLKRADLLQRRLLCISGSMMVGPCRGGIHQSVYLSNNDLDFLKVIFLIHISVLSKGHFVKFECVEDIFTLFSFGHKNFVYNFR